MNRQLPARLGRFAIVVLGALSVSGQPAFSQETPRFRSGVDVVPIDVAVVDSEGRPVPDLLAPDFKVFINGVSRRVVTADWISFVAGPPRPDTIAAEGYSSNQQASGGRLIVLAFDQPNIRFGGGRVIKEAIDHFLDRLSASDRVALIGLGRGARSIPFTADRNRIKQAVAGLNGQLQAGSTTPIFRVALSLESAREITRGNTTMIEMFIENCTEATDPKGREFCEAEIIRMAHEAVQNATEPRDSTIRGLSDALSSLRSINAPKSLVLVTEGLAMFDGEEEVRSQLTALGSLAAAARTSIYALRIDDRRIDVASAGRQISPASDAQIRTDGLEALTTGSRGALFTVTSTGDAAFARIESELSGSYLLGVETPPDIGPGQSSPLRVEVARNGVTVRARTQFTTPAADAGASARSTQVAAVTALTTPVTLSDLPLRVISFNFQGSDPSTLQLLIHADVGQAYSAPQSVAVAYIITDDAGRMIESQAVTSRLQPGSTGVPSPLVFSAGAALPPGNYLLKLAAAEGDKIGSVEHPIKVSLVDGGGLQLSDLTVGGPVQSGTTPLRPSVGYTVHFGVVHAYLEAYGTAASTASVKYEVARDEQSPALVSEVVAARAVGQSRALFSKMVPISALPPGRYHLRALVDVGSARVGTLSRAFEIAKPDAATDAPRTDVVLRSGTELFLPIDAADLRVPFQVAEALRSEVLQPFASRVPAAAKASFEEGVGHLRSGDYISAEASFKRAIQPGLDFTAAVTYLAVTFAASGHDAEAASAWQTALVGGGHLPQVYVWLGDALLRIREFARARPALEEALRRWPSDARFARPLALLNATTGKGYEAMQRLQQYLAARDDDAGALYLGVQWIYEIHLSGATIRDRAADVELARTYADAYLRANGPKQPILNQWVDYLVKSAR